MTQMILLLILIYCFATWGVHVLQSVCLIEGRLGISFSSRLAEVYMYANLCKIM
jgi:hypothetical protein